jgi:hypothetical protein
MSCSLPCISCQMNFNKFDLPTLSGTLCLFDDTMGEFGALMKK